MIIDGHVHIGRWNYKYYSSLSVNIKDLNKLLDECGIDGAVIIPTDTKNNVEVLRDITSNGCRKYWFFPWCSPRDKNCIEFLFKNLKYISGLKIHSSLDNIKGGITNKLYAPFLSFAVETKVPIIVHCGKWQEFASYKFILKMAKKHKNIKFIITHLGGDSESLKIEVPREIRKAKLDNVWLDISATREFWTIGMGIKVLGYKKFIFGSDYPVMHPRMSIVSIDELDLTDAQKEGIFSKNILNILKDRNLPISGGEK